MQMTARCSIQSHQD